MRIAAYITPGAFRNPTGQAKHALNMLQCLSRQPGVKLTLLVARDRLTSVPELPAGYGLGEVQVTSLPFPTKALHYFWRTCNLPAVDRWCGQVDWVYAPTEVYVPTRKARTASTIHSVGGCTGEYSLPWSESAGRVQCRTRTHKVFAPILDRADKILTVSQFARERICSYFDVHAERLGVVGNGVEPHFFSPRDDRGLGAALPYVFAVSYPSRTKGFDLLIRVADEFVRRRSLVRIRIVGAGVKTGRELEKFRHKWGSEAASLLGEARRRPNVDLLGYVSGAAVAELMRGSLATLVLSRHETFGIPAVEAMAAGTPVIVSRSAGLPEVVGDAGILIDPDMPDTIVDRILGLQSQPLLRAQWIKAGAKRARLFTWDSCATRLLKILKEASNFCPPAPPGAAQADE